MLAIEWQLNTNLIFLNIYNFIDWGTTEEGSVYRFRVPLEEYYKEVEQLYEQK